MEYRKFGNDYVVRMDRGEEILACVAEVCQKEKIKLGTVNGLGAVGDATLGVFSREKFEYLSEHYTGDFEIASCSGNISEMNGEVYLHIHIVIGNVHENKVYAGHLNAATVSLTGEFFIHKIEGGAGREYSKEVGLNLIRFKN